MDGWILDQSYREEERGGIETDKIESGERLLCFLPRGSAIRSGEEKEDHSFRKPIKNKLEIFSKIMNIII